MKHASICLLAYKRQEMLKECIESLKANTDYPHTIIVNLDGGDLYNYRYLIQLLEAKRISSLILNGGQNRGVGRSLANCIGLCEGDYIFKADTDLVFKPGWLSQAIIVLEKNPDVGAVSLFNYRDIDPNDTRFNILEERSDCRIVDDFVSSVYGFRKEDLAVGGWQEDDGFHTKLKEKYGKLALTKKNTCLNQGFGVDKSVYVSGTMDHPYKTPTFDTPLVF